MTDYIPELAGRMCEGPRFATLWTCSLAFIFPTISTEGCEEVCSKEEVGICRSAVELTAATSAFVLSLVGPSSQFPEPR